MGVPKEAFKLADFLVVLHLSPCFFTGFSCFLVASVRKPEPRPTQISASGEKRSGSPVRCISLLGQLVLPPLNSHLGLLRRMPRLPLHTRSTICPLLKGVGLSTSSHSDFATVLGLRPLKEVSVFIQPV